jgi:hypothetical protein
MLCGLAAAFLLLPSAAPAWAAGLFDPATSLDMQAASRKTAPLARFASRSRLVRINTAELTRHVAPLGMDTAPNRVQRAAALDGVVTLQLFPDLTVTFKRSEIDTVGDRGYAWTGQIDGSPLKFASLIVDEGQVTGHIQLLRRLFKIEPLGNGVHRVTELVPSLFPPEHPGKPGKPALNDDNGDAAPAITPRAKTQIRVLVAYTNAAKAEDANIVNDIKQAVSLANTAYNNTGIPIRIVLAKIMSAGTYNESSDIQNDLNNLDGSNGTTLRNVRRQRNRVNADLVSMFRKSDPNFCGIANLTDRPRAATKSLAYSVMVWGCISNLSFHHELGHNMGLRHDRYVDPTRGVGYNHGYVNTNSACKIRTVMGYNNRCTSLGFCCTRINAFSTENFVYMVGNTNCRIGTAKGKRKAADNTQRLKETRSKIRGYR